jgi:predicted ribonuclease YlaK
LRPAILFLDTNILLDCPRAEDYRLPGRQVTVVVIPEVMRELHGLSRAPERGQAGPALQALATLEPLSRRRGSAVGVPLGRSGATIRILPGHPATGGADRELVLRAKAERDRSPESLVAVVTKDWGVAELARAERVKSILIKGSASTRELEREIARHDTVLDIDV